MEGSPPLKEKARLGGLDLRLKPIFDPLDTVLTDIAHEKHCTVSSKPTGMCF